MAVQPPAAAATEEKSDVCSLIDAVDVEFIEVVDTAVLPRVVTEPAPVTVPAEVALALQRSSPAISRSAVCEDEQKVAEYAPSIYLYMISHEECFRPVAGYLEKHVEVNFKMRRILCDWLHEVHYKFRLLPETFFLMINYVDRFLTEKTEYAPISQSTLPHSLTHLQCQPRQPAARGRQLSHGCQQVAARPLILIMLLRLVNASSSSFSPFSLPPSPCP